MALSQDKIEKPNDFLTTAKKVAFWPAVGLSAWFGLAAVVGAIGEMFYLIVSPNSKNYLKMASYVPETQAGQCLAVDPIRRQVVTVQAYPNGRFNQVMRAAAPVISRMEGETVVLGHAPKYMVGPCSILKPSGVSPNGLTVYETHQAAQLVEAENSRALADAFEAAYTGHRRVEWLWFTTQFKAPAAQPAAPQM